MKGAYYNERDPFAVQWLRNLIAAGLIAPGEVDERDVREVRPEDLTEFVQCHFFAGIGVWSYALRLAGWPDDRPIWTGSCPCQPFASPSRGRRKGFDDDRDLWPEFSRLIRAARPGIVLGEQVATGDGPRWLDRTWNDLDALGYSVGAVRACASAVRLPRRDRLFFAASDSDGQGQRDRALDAKVAGLPAPAGLVDEDAGACRSVGPPFPGTPASMARLRAYGNAIVAPLAAEFVRAVMVAWV